MRDSRIRGRGWEYISHLCLGNTLIYSIEGRCSRTEELGSSV